MSQHLIFLVLFFSCNTLMTVLTKTPCHLEPEKVSEIHTYKHIVRRILDDINFKHGHKMYTEYTKFIDKFGPRPCGSANLEDSIDYMINLTNKFDLDDVTTEELSVPYWKRGSESLEMVLPFNRKLDLLGLGLSVSTPDEGITAEAIVVKNFDELDDIADGLVEGKIVLFNAHFTNYEDTVIYRNHGAAKAAKKGAVAALVRSVTPFSLYTPHTGVLVYSENVTQIPAAAITTEDADFMQRLQDQMQKIVLKLVLLNSLSTEHSRNTIIDLKGEKSPEKMVIVSGHIDSWDVGTGAIDDGGGMFISWFVPVILNHLRLKMQHRTLRAILWTCEEIGLNGAADYVERHNDTLSNINLIMESDEGTFKPLGLSVMASEEAQCIIEEILKLFDSNIMEPSNSPPSDIELFVKRGVPAAGLLTQNDRYFYYHHSKADTLSVQNPDDLINSAAFWTAFSYVVAELSFDIPWK